MKDKRHSFFPPEGPQNCRNRGGDRKIPDQMPAPEPPSTGGQPVTDIWLMYPGKTSPREILATPPARVRRLSGSMGEENANDENRLYFGDNLPILSHLYHDPHWRGRFRLIYIDPPFASGSNYQSRSQAEAYTDRLSGGAYLEFLRRRLILLRELLAEDGSIYVHLDNHMAFHVKVLMDEIFGSKNFRNWITRRKCHPKNSTRRHYGKTTDYILFYTRSEKYVWNRPVQPWTPEKLKCEYPCVEPESGRRYRKVPLHAPGERRGATGQPWRGQSPPRGKHWQFPPDTLEAMDARGEIYWSPTGNPRRKVYADESPGMAIQDLWLDFQDACNQNHPTTGYPTEKNHHLVRRIVETSSREGDYVLDCFCGSGTTLEVATFLGRRWVGVDESREAILATLARLKGEARPVKPINRMVDAQAQPRMAWDECPLMSFGFYTTEASGAETLWAEVREVEAGTAATLSRPENLHPEEPHPEKTGDKVVPSERNDIFQNG